MNNVPYKFQYRRRFLWKSFTVVGHCLEKEQNKMVLYFPNGGVREIKNWSSHEMILGADWVLAMKAFQERQAGQPISLAVG